MNAPVVYLVHAEKGIVWSSPSPGFSAKLVTLKGDTVKVEIYKGDLDDETKAVKATKLSLSKLLR